MRLFRSRSSCIAGHSDTHAVSVLDGVDAMLPEIPPLDDGMPEIPLNFATGPSEWWPYATELDKLRATCAALETECRLENTEKIRHRDHMHKERESAQRARAKLAEFAELLTKVHTAVSNATRRIRAGQLDTAAELLDDALRDLWGANGTESDATNNDGHRLNIAVGIDKPGSEVVRLGDTLYVRVRDLTTWTIRTEVALPVCDLYAICMDGINQSFTVV